MLLEDTFEIDDDELRKKIIKNNDFGILIQAFSFYLIVLIIVIFINRKLFIYKS